MAIYNIIKRCKATTKNAYVDGIAASISSVIPMACDKVYMPTNSMMMIHNPMGGARGDASDLRKMAEALDKVKDTLVEVYKSKTGKDDEELKKMMDDETWMTASDAIEMGFADELQEEVKIAASINEGFLIFNNEKFDTKNFKKIPKIENRADDPEPVSDKSILQKQLEEFGRIKNKIYGGIV
jgi:ATP-dependent Clp protease, protease subunit